MAAPGDGGRFLVIFDFDETLANESSDDAVVRAAPGQALPDWLRASYREGQYNEQMQRVMAYLAQQGVVESAIRAEIQRIPQTPGLAALLDFLRAHGSDFECVVMSDANSYFIETWLQHAGARQLFLEIFTNPAHFDASGQLVLTPFHAHSCPRCPDNMCKQRILRDFLCRRGAEGKRAFQRVFYVGDGANDVCPCLALGPRDTAFARAHFPLHHILTDLQRTPPQHSTDHAHAQPTAHTTDHAHAQPTAHATDHANAQPTAHATDHANVHVNVQPWTTGHDIIEHLQRALEER